MNILSRSFSAREKALMVVLGIIIIGALYYLLFLSPMLDQIASANANSEALENQLVAMDAKVERIKNMQKSVKNVGDNGHIVSMMPSYSAGKKELDFLNTTLAESEDYYVGFTKITREGDQIRREFSLKFTVAEYKEAEKIMDELEHSELRCLISDFEVNTVEQDGVIAEDEIEASCVATFYETMYNAVPDAELPPDTKKSDDDVIGTYEYESDY